MEKLILKKSYISVNNQLNQTRQFLNISINPTEIKELEQIEQRLICELAHIKKEMTKQLETVN